VSASGTHVAYIGLGSNLGPRDRNITGALNALQSTRDVDVDAVSKLYETQAVGGPPGQPAYMNGVARIRTKLTPERLLQLLQSIERSLGRSRGSEQRWGPRTIDLDILLYDDAIISTPELMIPHPLMHERRFVLEPLAEIAPEVVHPAINRTARDLLSQLGDGEGDRFAADE